jgi:cyclopropane fatty-acyl-phospholipid synthase-like methyltransferase
MGTPLKDGLKWLNEARGILEEGEVFSQVGRTVGGIPTGAQDLVSTSEAILSALRPSPAEVVLDLCCGNGLISERIAPHCGSLIGVDFSESLIQVARMRSPKIKFILSDVTTLDSALLGVDLVDAAYMTFSFQCFDETMVHKLLNHLRVLAKPRFRLFLESIPDIERIMAHFHTPERMAAYQKRKAEGTELIPNWWSTKQLATVARAEGFSCDLIMQSSDRVSSHYRFDALLTPIA